ncbi:holin family protein [Rhodobacter capsulatus]|uniref:Holin of 3TMs, for gene-transfer release n=1 Tax=Rhodobacter capsulatus TaxID=1061 RepID=A0A1G7F6L6_RHOCA|nr:holin family protein [Rhodobacter capsulatus]WER09941.1 holin family protein [Rhodobacter capsulatus]SDE71583.1 Holin of 3TMs, for gene-transfer release [Rhodobacter capsulatus]
MGLIGTILGSPAATGAIGTAVTSVAEVFTPNATKKLEADAAAWQAALAEHGAEFQYDRPGLFDRFVNGLNRLPRPMLALGTLGLFVYAMIDPAGFAARMVGLNAVPEPLWWLLGAIVGFYFGAREFHYSRARMVPAPAPVVAPEDNPALSEFLSKGAAGAAPAT